MPNVAPWLSRIVDCTDARLGVVDLVESTVPLLSWWNSGRGDNFATTDPYWGDALRSITFGGAHLVNGSAQEGYGLYRFEGSVADPLQAAPEGTVPLYSWWNPDRGDNFATTDPRWTMDPNNIVWNANNQHITNGPSREGYTLYRLEGYVWDRLSVPAYCER